MNQFLNGFAGAVTAMATGTMIGFLAVGAVAKGIDTIESARCPGVARTQANTGTILKDWAAYGACPRAGLTAPLHP